MKLSPEVKSKRWQQSEMNFYPRGGHLNSNLDIPKNIFLNFYCFIKWQVLGKMGFWCSKLFDYGGYNWLSTVTSHFCAHVRKRHWSISFKISSKNEKFVEMISSKWQSGLDIAQLQKIYSPALTLSRTAGQHVQTVCRFSVGFTYILWWYKIAFSLTKTTPVYTHGTLKILGYAHCRAKRKLKRQFGTIFVPNVISGYVRFWKKQII